jgi:hypothetical protein
MSLKKGAIISESLKVQWYRESKITNYRRPIMYPDKNGHITEYTQIKISSEVNILLDRKYRDLIKQHKFRLDKNNNIVNDSSIFLLKLLYPNIDLKLVYYKNNYQFDLRECNIGIKNE